MGCLTEFVACCKQCKEYDKKEANLEEHENPNGSFLIRATQLANIACHLNKIGRMAEKAGCQKMTEEEEVNSEVKKIKNTIWEKVMEQVRTQKEGQPEGKYGCCFRKLNENDVSIKGAGFNFSDKKDQLYEFYVWNTDDKKNKHSIRFIFDEKSFFNEKSLFYSIASWFNDLEEDFFLCCPFQYDKPPKSVGNEIIIDGTIDENLIVSDEKIYIHLLGKQDDKEAFEDGRITFRKCTSTVRCHDYNYKLLKAIKQKIASVSFEEFVIATKKEEKISSYLTFDAYIDKYAKPILENAKNLRKEAGIDKNNGESLINKDELNNGVKSVS